MLGFSDCSNCGRNSGRGDQYPGRLVCWCGIGCTLVSRMLSYRVLEKGFGLEDVTYEPDDPLYRWRFYFDLKP